MISFFISPESGRGFSVDKAVEWLEENYGSMEKPPRVWKWTRHSETADYGLVVPDIEAVTLFSLKFGVTIYDVYDNQMSVEQFIENSPFALGFE
jgi:hypothetical protein